jgi:4-hydroxybutyrate CoA-transferase
MVAVNAPLEITLWGEIGIERVGARYFRGVGGQVEFVVGALLSDGGRSIHAVLSRKRTADGRWVSTIVPEFTPPGVASVSRQFADLVVTEYGVARLLGKTERERAEELIGIAHPDFRAELREAAKQAFGVGRRTIALGV